MAHYAVKYQLNNKKDYQPLWDDMAKLKAHKATRALYLVDYSGTARQLTSRLTPLIDDDDMLFVAPLVERPVSHKCYTGTNDWISARF